MKETKRILYFIIGLVIIVLAIVGNYLMYKDEIAQLEADYNTKLSNIEQEMKDVYNQNQTVHSMTELEDANSIYLIGEKFISTFYSIGTTNDWDEIEATLKKCMTTDAYNQYTPLASGSRGEEEIPYTITVSAIEVYLNYENYTSNSVSATIFFKQKMETENIDGEEQPFIWKGTFIKEGEDWKVNEIELNTLIQI